jgi:hypothetical protein
LSLDETKSFHGSISTRSDVVELGGGGHPIRQKVSERLDLLSISRALGKKGNRRPEPTKLVRSLADGGAGCFSWRALVMLSGTNTSAIDVIARHLQA